MNMSYCTEVEAEPSPSVPLATSHLLLLQHNDQITQRKSEVGEEFGDDGCIGGGHNGRGVENEVMLQQRLFYMGLVLSLQW